MDHSIFERFKNHIYQFKDKKFSGVCPNLFHARTKYFLIKIAEDEGWNVLSCNIDFTIKATGLTSLFCDNFKVYIWKTHCYGMVRVVKNAGEISNYAAVVNERALYEKNFESFFYNPYEFISVINNHDIESNTEKANRIYYGF